MPLTAPCAVLTCIRLTQDQWFPSILLQQNHWYLSVLCCVHLASINLLTCLVPLVLACNHGLGTVARPITGSLVVSSSYAPRWYKINSHLNLMPSIVPICVCVVLCCVVLDQLRLVDCKVDDLAGVYSIAFLLVMAMFAMGNVLLKVRERRLVVVRCPLYQLAAFGISYWISHCGILLMG